MRVGAGLVLSLLVIAGCAVPADGERVLEDDLGRAVDVGDLARIVPTSVDVVEILLELGHRDRIAAVPDWIHSEVSCVTAPPGAEDLPRVGRPHVIRAEEVLALAPTLVIQKDHPLQPTNLHEQLARAGVSVFVLDNTESLDNVRHTYRRVAEILEAVDADAPAAAEASIARFDAAIANVTTVLEGADEPTFRAVYQFPAGLVAGAGTSGSLLVQLAGAQDVAAASGLSGYKQLSHEALAAADPERVVASCTAAGSADVVFGAPKYRATTAAQLRPETLRVVDPSMTGLVGPRFPAGLAEVAHWLHPAAFGLIEPRVDLRVEGRTVHVDASNSTARDGPPTFRFLPGDASAARDDAHGRFTFTYSDAGSYSVRVLVIDAAARVHEHRAQVNLA